MPCLEAEAASKLMTMKLHFFHDSQLDAVSTEVWEVLLNRLIVPNELMLKSIVFLSHSNDCFLLLIVEMHASTKCLVFREVKTIIEIQGLSYFFV